ncbi:hypothetical protein P154DRAFT_530260 [Amniculicola lignicola CBS 123094]|uniref:Uncharacterized protein n=1 Tax=Amniculicola lignicola CBS 123094 TaxID=1392246 RepID=A0A6A5WYW0_9PLEO|nr:hypothetical protein P154DRAFT_530260 [Amniculicola lignicola CBS 123094]
MSSTEQLSIFPAAEGLGRVAMEGSAPCSPKHEEEKASSKHGITIQSSYRKSVSSSSSTRSPKVEKRTRKAASSLGGPYLHPMPTIETIMTYPDISRPVYDSLVRGEPPAQSYKTVIHIPKPPTIRILDDNLLRAAEISAFRRRHRARTNSTSRSRSSSGSSVAGSGSGYSTENSTPENSAPSTPLEMSKGTDASTEPSPLFLNFPKSKEVPDLIEPISPQPFTNSLLSPAPPVSPSPSTESNIIGSYSRESSPAQSWHTTHSEASNSSLENNYDENEQPYTPTLRSAAPSPSSSAYPSPPASPIETRRSSSSGEEFMYPSPPPSPMHALHSTAQGRERRAFTFPAQHASPPIQPRLTRSSSLSSHPWFPEPSTPSHASSTYSHMSTPALSNTDTMSSAGTTPNTTPLLDGAEFDLGAQKLGVSLYEDEDSTDAMEWSMNGGKVFLGDGEHKVEMGSVVFGAAGIAMSPRALKGGCCECEFQDIACNRGVIGTNVVIGSGGVGPWKGVVKGDFEWEVEVEVEAEEEVMGKDGVVRRGLGLYVIDEEGEEEVL